MNKIFRGLHIKMKHRTVNTSIKRRKQNVENTLWKLYGPKLCLLAIVFAIIAQLQGKSFSLLVRNEILFGEACSKNWKRILFLEISRLWFFVTNVIFQHPFINFFYLCYVCKKNYAVINGLWYYSVLLCNNILKVGTYISSLFHCLCLFLFRRI